MDWAPLQAEGRLIASAWPSATKAGDVITVVFEGDGDAFDARGRARADPTPRDPLGYRIASAWPAGPVVWLGRLCQFVGAQDRACSPRDWTAGRFSETAVRAASAAVDQAMARADARRVTLVGWSGGGVLAVLVAQRRTDVAAVVTFAAPLDLAAWARWHRMAPLDGSLDPAEGFDGVAPPQINFFGDFDAVVPPASAAPAAMRLGGRVVVRPERHDCCWVRRIPEALNLLNDRSLRPQAEP